MGRIAFWRRFRTAPATLVALPQVHRGRDVRGNHFQSRRARSSTVLGSFHRACRLCLNEGGILVAKMARRSYSRPTCKARRNARKGFSQDWQFYQVVVPTHVGGAATFAWEASNSGNRKLPLEMLFQRHNRDPVLQPSRTPGRFCLAAIRAARHRQTKRLLKSGSRDCGEARSSSILYAAQLSIAVDARWPYVEVALDRQACQAKPGAARSYRHHSFNLCRLFQLATAVRSSQRRFHS